MFSTSCTSCFSKPYFTVVCAKGGLRERERSVGERERERETERERERDRDRDRDSETEERRERGQRGRGRGRGGDTEGRGREGEAEGERQRRRGRGRGYNKPPTASVEHRKKRRYHFATSEHQTSLLWSASAPRITSKGGRDRGKRCSGVS